MVKGPYFFIKKINEREKNDQNLKFENFDRSFYGLGFSFFPDTYFFILINQRIDPKFGSTFPLECNQLNDQQFDHSS